MTPEEQQIREILGKLIEPKLKWSLADLNLIRQVKLEGDRLEIAIDLITDDLQERQAFEADLRRIFASLKLVELKIELGRVDVAKQGLRRVKKVILVGSGKGGVGKSSVAVNLAAMLKLKGYQVGLMDADIYGPSIPQLMGLTQKPQVAGDEVLLPVEQDGIKCISVGSLVPPGKAISWRGQLVSGTILQFIRKVNWGELDFLVIDMPPGTGEVQLTLAQELKSDGVILVTMPQLVVIGDVARSLDQYQDKKIPILVLVENMTSYCCEACGHEQEIFPGPGTGLEGIPRLARLPLDRDFCQSGNLGRPYVLLQSEGVIFEEFSRLAQAVSRELVGQGA